MDINTILLSLINYTIAFEKYCSFYPYIPTITIDMYEHCQT